MIGWCCSWCWGVGGRYQSNAGHWQFLDTKRCAILPNPGTFVGFEDVWGDKVGRSYSGNLWILQQNGEKKIKIQPQHIRFSIKDLRTHFLEVLDWLLANQTLMVSKLYPNRTQTTESLFFFAPVTFQVGENLQDVPVPNHGIWSPRRSSKPLEGWVENFMRGRTVMGVLHLGKGQLGGVARPEKHMQQVPKEKWRDRCLTFGSAVNNSIQLPSSRLCLGSICGC